MSRICALILLVLDVSQASQFRLSSSDLRIVEGSRIVVDRKPVGTAPCLITLSTNVRYKFEITGEAGSTRMFFVTEREVKKSDVVNNIPAWFFDPTSIQPDFRDYETLTPATASSTSLAESIDKAKKNAAAKFKSGRVDRYYTIRGSDRKEKLDSSSSRYYPKLTRGQMDSLADVNGGKIVARSLSLPTDSVFLEIEIQSIGPEFRVYVLFGNRKS